MKPPHFLKHLITLQASDPEGFHFCLLVFLLSFILPLSCKNLWGSCHSPILFSITFMWQLSIYCAPIPNPPFALPCNSRTRPYKQSSLTASTTLVLWLEGSWKDSQRQEQQEDIFIRVPVLCFKIQYRSPMVLKDELQLHPQAMLFPSDSTNKFLCHRQHSHTHFKEAEFQPGVGEEALS